MAVQTQQPTDEGFGEIGKLVAGEETVANAAMKKVFCLVTAKCVAADTTNTYADNIKNVCIDTGLDLQDADSVKTVKTDHDNDTVELDNVFTAATGEVVSGFCWANAGADILFGVCCFAAEVTLAKTDTLTVQAKNKFKED
jgi:hypothetical protein